MVFEIILIILGLALFEMITSMDNAVINAEVLSTLSQKMRRWFLTWGMLFAVFLMRGLLPLAIVMLSSPGLSITDALLFGTNGVHNEALEASSKILLIGGGVFLVCVFLHWLFMEKREFGLQAEAFFYKRNVWFYAVVSIFLMALVWFAIKINPIMAFSVVAGSTIFFIVHGFRLNAEKLEDKMMHDNFMSDWAKVFYLEAIDASFSIDGVVGAFAFTLSVPLIIIGNGIGAVAVRQLTVANIDRIKKYKYLKHGAMYSIFVLGTIMIAESFGWRPAAWISPTIMFLILGFFMWKSMNAVKKDQLKKEELKK